MIRPVLFWIHLTAGVIAGLVILLMSVTGTLLTFQQTVLAFIEREQRRVEAPAGGVPLEVDALLARVREMRPGAQPSTVTFDWEPESAVMVNLGAQGLVFVDPYTGNVLGSGSTRARAFYRTVTNWHRWLAMEGDQRPLGRSVTGACNAAFLVLAITGLFLWWPRQLTVRHVGAVLWFRRGLRGRARDFNWHNAIGFWCAPVLVVLTATGMVISYPWASNLVYTLTGSPVPPGGRGGGSNPAPAERGSTRESATVLTLEQAVQRARAQVPTWRTIVLRLPARDGGAISFTISDRQHWNAFARSTLTIDPGAPDRARWEPYAATSLGQKVRGWMRFAHTGELGGRTGELVAGLASAGGAVLVYTGLALAWRRLLAWRGRRLARRPAAASAEEFDAA
jgi:uncharacterized iron-regulated membrane protein